MSFGASPKSIMNLFRGESNTDRYKIPKYQRAYSWTDEEVNDFCSDLEGVFLNKMKDYFFGALITIKDNDDENTHIVVDGQQRITTFTMFMAQLYNLCGQTIKEIQKIKNNDIENEIKYELIEETLIEKKSDLGQCLKYKSEYRLNLSEIDKEYFTNLLKLSEENKILTKCDMIIKLIEIKDSIKTNQDRLKKYKKSIKNDIFKNSQVPKDITYVEFEKIYLSKFTPSDNHNKQNMIKNLKIKYLQDRSKINKIAYYISGSHLKSEDEQIVTDFLNTKLKETNIVSQKYLKNAWEIIQERLIKRIINIEELDDRINELIKTIDIFINDIHIVVISANNEDDAITMFQVLNDRGRNLGVIELLRPYTLQKVEKHNKYKEDISKWWDNLSESDDCVDYLKNYLASYTKVLDREKKLHNKYKEKFFEGKSNIEIYENIKKIYKNKIIYNRLKDGKWPYENSKQKEWVKNRLYEIIKQLGYKKTIPLLICIYELGTEADFIKAIDIIERTVFRYVTVCEKRAGEVTNIYNQTIIDARNINYFSINNFKENMKKLLKYDGCEIDIFKEKLNGKKMKYASNNKHLKYFLSTIEYYYSDYIKNPKKKMLDDPTTSIKITDATEIEHIYPQSAKTQIASMEDIKHNIGNLTLIEDDLNKENSNNDFSEKQVGYDREKIEITKILSDTKKISNWNINEYNKRLDMYRDIASKIFTVDGI